MITSLGTGATVTNGCASSHCTKKHLPGERIHKHEYKGQDPVHPDIQNTSRQITHEETNKEKS